VGFVDFIPQRHFFGRSEDQFCPISPCFVQNDCMDASASGVCCENEVWRMNTRDPAVSRADEPLHELASWFSSVLGVAIVLQFASSPSLLAQRAFEKDGHVIYENSQGHAQDLGAGFSPAITQSGQVAMIRGRFFMYGEEFDCGQEALRNWISVYDPATHTEKTLFDRPLAYGRDDFFFCVFQRMQLSPDGLTLYLTSPVYATSGSLAIIRLKQGAVTYVPGVDDVYVIVKGPHRGELLYQQRRDEPGAHYPFVHARADGTPIKVLAEEFLNEGEKAPRLKAYLQTIHGQIIVDGRVFPNSRIAVKVP